MLFALSIILLVIGILWRFAIAFANGMSDTSDPSMFLSPWPAYAVLAASALFLIAWWLWGGTPVPL